jgi:RNA polymerase sigma-70 factor (ECF subfamily)
MTEAESDEALMVLVAARDQRAFRILLARHMGRAIRVAERVIRDAAEADDIGQDAFLRVWNHARAFDPRVARFTTWLYRIVINLSLDRTRRPAHQPIEAAAEVRSTEPEPLQRVMEDEERRVLAAALARLSERQRAAITLFHMEGLSGRDAAQAMNLSEKAFESLLTRARATLKQDLAEARESERRYA